MPIFLSSKAIPVILEIQGRFSVVCALVAFPAHPTREETCTLRARNRYKPPAHLKQNIRETGAAPQQSFRRRSGFADVLFEVSWRFVPIPCSKCACLLSSRVRRKRHQRADN